MTESYPQSYIPESDEGCSFSWGYFPAETFTTAGSIGLMAIENEIAQQAYFDIQLLRTSEGIATLARKLSFLAVTQRESILAGGRVSSDHLDAVSGMAMATGEELVADTSALHGKISLGKSNSPEYSKAFDALDERVNELLLSVAISMGIDLSKAENLALLSNQLFKLIDRNIIIQLQQKLVDL